MMKMSHLFLPVPAALLEEEEESTTAVHQLQRAGI
jgi:hypothetical protein